MPRIKARFIRGTNKLEGAIETVVGETIIALILFSKNLAFLDPVILLGNSRKKEEGKENPSKRVNIYPETSRVTRIDRRGEIDVRRDHHHNRKRVITDAAVTADNARWPR